MEALLELLADLLLDAVCALFMSENESKGR